MLNGLNKEYRFISTLASSEVNTDLMGKALLHISYLCTAFSTQNNLNFIFVVVLLVLLLFPVYFMVHLSLLWLLYSYLWRNFLVDFYAFFSDGCSRIRLLSDTVLCFKFLKSWLAEGLLYISVFSFTIWNKIQAHGVISTQSTVTIYYLVQVCIFWRANYLHWWF